MKDSLANLVSWSLKRISGGRELMLVSAVYLFLTVVLTYPTVLRLGSHIPGLGDAPTMVWDLWAMTRAIIDPQVPLSTTDLIFFPLSKVVSQWTSPGNVLVSLPLAIVSGPVLAYNVLFLSSFVLAALFAYLLLRYLSVGTLASFAAGCLFSFSAYHYARGLGHWSLCSLQWLPLCALCFLQLRAKPDLTRSMKFVIATCLVVWTFHYFAAYFLAPMLACLFAYGLWQQDKALLRPRLLATVALALGVAALGLVLFFGDVAFPGEDMAAALRTSAKDTERYSADLLAFFLPAASHPLFGDIVAPIYDNFSARGNTAEMTVYLGWVALLLAGWGLIKGKRAEVSVWAILALVGFILSLGPVLRVNGRALFPLPYTLLMKLPLLVALRAPSRAGITVLLGVTVLAGYGLSDLLSRLPRRPVAAAVITTAVVLVACCESLLGFPYPTSSAEVPRFYEEMLPASSQYGALFQLPSGSGHSDSTGWYMFYQMEHHRKLAIGYQPREPLDVVLFPRWVLRGKFLSPPVALPQGDTWRAFEAVFADLLAYNGITNVVVQRQAGPFAETYSQAAYEEVQASLSRALGEATYEDDSLTAYEVSPVTPQTLASFSGGLELVGHKLVEATFCPEGTPSCTYLVTLWRAAVELPQRYGINVQLVRPSETRVLADTSHNLGYQFTLGEEVACYNTSWWSPNVVVSDYALLPSVDREGAPLSGAIDIKIRVTDPQARVALEARSEDYPMDEQGRLLIEGYRR